MAEQMVLKVLERIREMAEQMILKVQEKVLGQMNHPAESRRKRWKSRRKKWQRR